MSEPIPESIPTSTSHPRRPHHTKSKPAARTTNNATSAQSVAISALFANPDRPINLPAPTTSTAQSSRLHAPPEIVPNVQGSSAGAGSGEFHVYKASRRREYERLRVMEEEAGKEERDREWEAKKEEERRKEVEKLEKNRSRRAKRRAGNKAGGDGGGGDGVGGEKRRKLAPPPLSSVVRKDDDDQGVGDDAEVDEVGGGGDEGGITFHDDD